MQAADLKAGSVVRINGPQAEVTKVDFRAIGGLLSTCFATFPRDDLLRHALEYVVRSRVPACMHACQWTERSHAPTRVHTSPVSALQLFLACTADDDGGGGGDNNDETNNRENELTLPKAAADHLLSFQFVVAGGSQPSTQNRQPQREETK